MLSIFVIVEASVDVPVTNSIPTGGLYSLDFVLSASGNSFFHQQRQYQKPDQFPSLQGGLF